jgi:hypothetical protein
MDTRYCVSFLPLIGFFSPVRAAALKESSFIILKMDIALVFCH